MEQVVVNFLMDENLKRDMEQVCNDIGISMNAAFIIFASKMSQEKKMPFEIDPFYSSKNMKRLKKAILDVKSGKSKLIERELIETDDD